MEITRSVELQDSTNTTDKQTSSNELITRDEVKDSPFTIIGIEGQYFATMGMYRITETYSSKEEAEEEVKKITWNRIIQVVQLLTEIQTKK